MTVGEVVKSVDIRTTKRGAKGKWHKLFATAKDNPGKFVCVAEAEDEEELRKLYNNVRSAAHRSSEEFEVVQSQDLKVYVKHG